MRILFPVHGIGAGVGSEDYMLAVARGLSDRGHEVTLVAPEGSEMSGWDAGRIVFSRPAPNPKPILWRVWYPIKVAFHIQAAVRIQAPAHDVVLTGLLPELFGRALRARRTPRVYQAMSPLAWFETLSYANRTVGLYLGALVYHWLQAWAWRRSAAVGCFTPTLAEVRRRWFGCEPKRVIVSPPGIDFNTYQPGPRRLELLEEFGIPPEAPLVVSFCRLIPSKDIPFLFNAFARTEIPGEAHLLVIGKGPEMDNLRQLAGTLGIAARVHFAGFREYVADYLRLGHAYAFTSRLESFGLTLAQAMACGLPAVARRHRFPEVLTFSEEMIDHDESGYLVDTEAQMADRIAAILTDPDRRSRLGRGAVAAMRERFRWDRHLDAIESALHAVVES